MVVVAEVTASAMETVHLNRSPVTPSQISERMLKQRLLAGIKRKSDHKEFAKNQADETTSFGSAKGRDRERDFSGCNNELYASLGRRSKALYNLYTTFYDEGEQFDPCFVQRGKGLSRACTILNAVKKGKINVKHLLLTLHTLGILVTAAEMHQALKFVPIDVHGNLDFGDFLCVIKETLPCNETDALQNAQEVFRKIKEDMVAIEELEPILACLGVTLSPMVIQQALECTQLSWDGKVNILTFLLTVRGATGLCTEVDDYATSQDFAAVGDLETLLRRKRSLLEGETQPGHANLFTFYDPDEGVTLAQLQKGKNKSQKSEGPRRPQTASPECHTEQKSKENQGIQWPKVRPHFGYTSQYTLFPLSSSLCFKEQDKQFVQKPNTKELSPRVDQKSAPSSVAQIRSSHEVFPQQRKKKMLTFQEKLPKRYDHEDNVHVANPKTSGSEGQQHSEDLSAQQGSGTAPPPDSLLILPVLTVLGFPAMPCQCGIPCGKMSVAFCFLHPTLWQDQPNLKEAPVRFSAWWYYSPSFGKGGGGVISGSKCFGLGLPYWMCSIVNTLVLDDSGSTWFLAFSIRACRQHWSLECAPGYYNIKESGQKQVA
ncbi:EF-hand calcium-binding domain-containing protein 13 [Varanus komodoensis]|nr:EF-hand calcium-binding domain-containing protein 13 [Varanus komodoensis]